MLLHIMLYIMLAYLVLFAALSNAVCLYNAFLQLIFANAACLYNAFLAIDFCKCFLSSCFFLVY